MPSRSNTPSVPAPFLFRGHTALVGELDIDGALRSRPATEEEAKAIGSLYRSHYDPRNPFASVEKALADYPGMTDRYVFLIAQTRGCKGYTYVVQDQNGFKVPVEYAGLLEYFITSVVSFLERSGVSPALIQHKILPQFAPESTKSSVIGRWVIGYERETGNVAILDCSRDFTPATLFLADNVCVAALDLAALKSSN